MDSARIQIVAVAVTGGLFFLVFELVRRRRLMERYALLWLFSTAVLLGLAVWRGLLERVASTVGHLLRAVRALRCRLRLRPGDAAALLAGHLAARRPEQGPRPEARHAAGAHGRGPRSPVRAASPSATPSASRGTSPSVAEMHDAPGLAVVVVCHDHADAIGPTLEALGPQLGPDDEVVVVDNASSDDTAAVARAAAPAARVIDAGAQPRLRRRLPRRRARLAGTAGAAAEPRRGPRARLPRRAARVRRPGARLGRVAGFGNDARRRAREHRRQRRALPRVRMGRGPRPPRLGLDARPHDVGFGSGAALVVRRDAWEAVGGFDERYFMYGEDLDLSLRLRLAGWGIGIAPPPVSPTTTPSARATTSGSTSSATAGGR